MIPKFPLLLTIIMTLCTFGVIAEGEIYYPNYNDGRQGTGFFNTAFDSDDLSVVGRAVTSPSLQPLIADLDNDSTNEIIIIDGDNVEVYQDSTLTQLNSDSAEDVIDHAIVYDIDYDGNLEVITTGGDKVSIFDFNSTHLTLTANYTILNSTGATGYEYMVGCKGTEDCIVVNARTKSGVPSIERIFVMRLNSTGVYNTTNLKTGAQNSDWYLPKIRTIEVGDMTGDGDTEFVFTAWGYDNTDLCFWQVDTSPTTGITEEDETCVDASYINSDPGRDDFTSPLVYDFDLSESGLETVIAFQADSLSEFEMTMYDSSGAEIQDYPDLSYEQGILISNPIRMNAFSDTGAVDFCVLGYDTTSNDLNLLCGSEQTTQDTVPGENWQYDGSAYYDLQTKK